MAWGWLVVGLFALSACGARATNGEQTSSGQKLKVVATTTIVGDVVRQVGGDAIDLTTLLVPGANPHSYEPTPQDIRTIAEADIVFANGAGYEAFMGTLIEHAGGADKVTEVSQNIELLTFEAEGIHSDEDEGDHAEGDDHDHEGGNDPHVWFNPQHVKSWVDVIAARLSAADASNAATYQANASAYKATLDSLDAWATEQLNTVPEARRKLVTDHDTFGYFAEHYGYTFVGAVLPSVSSAADPSAQQVALIEDVIREQQVPAVFVSSETNATLSQQVAADTGATIVSIPVESLTAAGTDADTYEKFMRSAVTKIVASLR